MYQVKHGLWRYTDFNAPVETCVFTMNDPMTKRLKNFALSDELRHENRQ